MIMTCGTIVHNILCERKGQICADFPACLYLLIILSSIADILHFQPGSTELDSPSPVTQV